MRPSSKAFSSLFPRTRICFSLSLVGVAILVPQLGILGLECGAAVNLCVFRTRACIFIWVFVFLFFGADDFCLFAFPWRAVCKRQSIYAHLLVRVWDLDSLFSVCFSVFFDLSCFFFLGRFFVMCFVVLLG